MLRKERACLHGEVEKQLIEARKEVWDHQDMAIHHLLSALDMLMILLKAEERPHD